MTLQNLLGISLDAVAPERAQVARMLAAVERNLSDAQLSGLSAEGRFDVSYNAILRRCGPSGVGCSFFPMISLPRLLSNLAA